MSDTGTSGMDMTAAVRAENPARLQAALDRGADPNMRDADGAPLLHLAILALNWPAADALMAHGADLNEPGPGGATPALLAATLNQFDRVERMIDRGADWRRPDDAGNTVAALVRERQIEPCEAADAQARLRDKLSE